MPKAHSTIMCVLLAASTFLVSCSSPTPVEDPGPNDWVVVTYSDTANDMPAHFMDALLGTEQAADQALQDADAGAIDGNDIGDHTYDLYFAGHDRNEMWKILKPILARASVAWTKVELRDGMDDEHPTILNAPR